MRSTFLPIATFVALSTLKYRFQKDHDEINSLFQQSQKEIKEWEIVRTTLMEQEKELENLTEELKPQREKNSTQLNLKDRLFFNPAFTAGGSMPLDTVFILLLIHMCGADLVTSISTVYHHMSPVGVLFDLAFSFILVVWLRKREKADLVKKNVQLQKELLRKEEDREDMFSTLKDVKTELENQRGRLKELLEEVEGEREVNKQRLQAVEKEITERKVTFDKPEGLLREKEELLRAQWTLDQRKKDNERQLLNTERLLEPIEIQITRMHTKKEVDFR